MQYLRYYYRKIGPLLLQLHNIITYYYNSNIAPLCLKFQRELFDLYDKTTKEASWALPLSCLQRVSNGHFLLTLVSLSAHRGPLYSRRLWLGPLRLIQNGDVQGIWNSYDRSINKIFFCRSSFFMTTTWYDHSHNYLYICMYCNTLGRAMFWSCDCSRYK